MIIAEGLLKREENGGYKLQGLKLAPGSRIEVMIGTRWIPVTIMRDNDDYYLFANSITFYPKEVYARYD